MTWTPEEHARIIVWSVLYEVGSKPVAHARAACDELRSRGYPASAAIAEHTRTRVEDYRSYRTFHRYGLKIMHPEKY